MGQDRYRSSAANPEKQVCYFNKPGDDVFYNTFISERIKEDKYSEVIYLLTRLKVTMIKKTLMQKEF